MFEPTDIYAFCLCSCFLILFLFRNVIPFIIDIFTAFIFFPAKAIGYCFLINRHALIGPFTVASAFLQLIYIGCNIVVLVYGVESVAQAASRAGTLSLVNMAPLYLATHLSFLADLFGLSLSTYQRLHRLCGLIAIGHVVFHGGFGLIHHSQLTAGVSSAEWYSLSGAIVMIFLVCLSIPLFRKRWYETFLRLHQILATAIVILVINHLISVIDYQWMPLYIFTAIFCLLQAFYVVSILYRNKKLGNSCSRLKITENNRIIKATVTLSRPLTTNPGQYFNIWVPSVSFFSSHPFTVTSWTSHAHNQIEMLIKQRDGFTHKLKAQDSDRRVFFSGPHGNSAPVWKYDYILLFASGFGIAPMLPYLRKLVYGCTNRKSRSKRIHLVWQVFNLNIRNAVADVIDSLLDEDKNYMLYISIYNGINMEMERSAHGRCTINPGTPNIISIFETESTGHSECAIAKSNSRSRFSLLKTLVLVSAAGDMRDSIRRVIRGYLAAGFELKELDYQPETEPWPDNRKRMLSTIRSV